MALHDMKQAIPGAAPLPSPLQRLVALYRSEAFRQSVRVALAMVIAYYVSLAMGWDRPHWAGLAVALCSLGTVGESFNKGLLRILGTFLAGSVAMALIILFPQDRWSYLLAATLYVAFCAYMMGHSSRWYVWFIGGYVMTLLALAAGPVGPTVFETVVLRLQQTTMGVVVYTLVATLLWPHRAMAPLIQTVSGLVDVQRRLIAHYVASLKRTPADVEASKLRAQATRGVAQLPADVDGAEVDSFEVWETRRLWRRCVADLAALNEALERWRHGFPELEKLDLERLMPDLATLAAELDARLAEVGRMLAGEAPRRWPEEVAPALDARALDTMARFDRAAVVCCHDQLHRIERLTRALFDTVADIRDFHTQAGKEHPEGASAAPWTIDPDRLTAAVRTFAAVWLILLAVLYIPDFPMPAGVIPVTAAAAIQLALMPQLPVRVLVVPVLGTVAFAGAFHIFVMPHLSSFVGLGTAIFIAIFLIGYVLAKPAQAMARGIGLSLFVMVIYVHNEQTYSFLYVFNFGLMFLLGLLAVGVSGWFPISFRPQQAVFKQLRRFLRSCDRLMVPQRGESGHWLRRMSLAFHVHEATTLPGKLDRWLAALPAVAEGRVTREQVQALADSLQALSGRVMELVEARRAEQSEAITRELTADMRAWRLGIQEILLALAGRHPAGMEAGALRSRLDAKLEALEARIETVLDTVPQGGASTEELDNMYRLLGAYRGVSEALVGLVQQTTFIDWRAVREERF
jgi:uncharacterized membrane protein YccC